MRQVLWFRRDLRVEDNALLHQAKDEVLPIFIFDKNILDRVEKTDKRVTFLYKSVLNLKSKLKSLGLDLAIFYGYPKEIFIDLKKAGFDEILCSIDYDNYAKKRDEKISKILPIKKHIDSFIINPRYHLKADNTPYKVFTPFFKSLSPLISSRLYEYESNKNLKLIKFDYSKTP